MGKLLSYDSIDSINNPSDHVAIKCVIDCTITYATPQPTINPQRKPNWHKANELDKIKYKQLLDQYLANISLPVEVTQCRNILCEDHFNEINNFYNEVTGAMIKACNDCIPSTKPNICKVVPGWNEYVDKYYKTALFWHKLWKENDCPENGLITDLRRATRSQYHKVCKIIMKCEGQIRSDKFAESLAQGNIGDFWSDVRKYRSRKSTLPGTVDGVTGRAEVADLFANKFEQLYNSVPYSDEDMMTVRHEINNAVLNGCLNSGCDDCVNHIISTKDVSDAINQLKCGKNDGQFEVTYDHIICPSSNLAKYLAVLFTCMLRHGVNLRKC